MAKLTGRTATGVIGKLLGVEEGTEGVVLLAGTVNGTITGSTTAGVHSALSGNDAQTVLKDTLIGGAAGGWIGGFSASLKLALSGGAAIAGATGGSGGRGSVWDNINATAENMPNTDIPATFQIRLDSNISYVNPTTNTNVLWTNANATEHMGEYVGRFNGETPSTIVRSQLMLESYESSLNKAMLDIAEKIPGRHEGIYGNWELGIDTSTGVVYHAQMLY